jgi:hypothetical protein
VRAAFFALVIAYGAASAGSFTPDVSIRRPIVLRFEGTFVADQEHARAGGFDAVAMRLGDDRRWLSARDVRTVGGDPPLNARTILNAIAPYDELMVVGDAELRRRVAYAPAGAWIRMDGVIDVAARTYLLRNVVGGAPPP